MKVFKFGGASVKDAAGVRNVQNVLEKTGNGPKVIVISAMGKTTNALEIVIKDYLFDKQIPESLQAVEDAHFEIINELFSQTQAPIFNKISTLFGELRNFLQHNKSEQYDFVYDQVICYGELVSTTIVSEYLNSQNIKNNWLDARQFVKTDSVYRDAGVNWEETQEAIQQNLNISQINITQGFIGSDPNNFTTTLGREGSDYTAAIFAYCLNAENVTIWKDVPGVLNADPREFQNPELLQQISYEEAIELAFYGASVIHPKTLQPLQQKEIPLFVKPFLKPESTGTKVGKGQLIFPEIPCFIVKKDLVLISLSTLDFSFMVEENMSEIFRLFHLYQMKVDLIQNSAISFSVCVDNKFNQLEKLLQHLKARFKVSFVPGVSLYTIRHFNDEAIKSLEKDKEILLKQLTHNTLQIVTRN
ncbi:aspartate kinase [Salegentibacter sp. LM13S]|uniref:aspartate kinase n=1 Tax=Salegentibacter lacus TaxID=2873599 RepID=UPI001CC940B4|nr:aspartate kinase [Salegentibacter lacus]MBZ9631136.1 aspartate kinase [Salegentibacter lacus]